MRPPLATESEVLIAARKFVFSQRRTSVRRELFAGNGFQCLLTPDSLPATIVDMPLGVQRMHCIPATPIFPADATLLQACLEGLDGRSVQLIRGFSQTTRAGIVPVIGFAGLGKTELLAYIAICFLHCEKIGRLYCAGPTNIAANNLADRLERVARETAQRLPAGHARRYMPVIIRGFNIKDEVRYSLDFVWMSYSDATFPGDKAAVAGPWRFRLSATYWL